MAVSIFLLEAQAKRDGNLAPATYSHLQFCVQALERVKISSPVINAALRLIYEEMNKLKLDYNIDPSIMGHAETNESVSSNNVTPGQPMPVPTTGDFTAADIFVPDASLLPAQWGDFMDVNPVSNSYVDTSGFAPRG